MVRKVNPASDPAHKETDRLIAKLEKKIKHIYSEAYGNAVEKFTSHMTAFEAKDRTHRADVSAGRWTEQEYKDWKQNQLLYGNTLAKIRDTIAADLHKADKIAIQMVRDQQVDVYALNHNYGTYEIEHGLGADTSYTLYDHDTVERLIEEDPDLLPKPSAKRQREIDAKDIAWNKQHLTSAFTASILSGDDIPTMATKIASVAEMDRHAAVRNARTMCTGAENGGRLRAYTRAQDMGINVKQQWVATLDGRTRDSHRIVDGEIIKVGEKFSNGLRFPGDPDGSAAETYNCRCCTVAVVNGIDPMAFDKSDTLRQTLGNTEITYDEWKYQHQQRQVNYAKVFINHDADGGIEKFSFEEVKNELRKSSVGQQTLDYLDNNANIRLMVNYNEVDEPSRGQQDGDMLTLNMRYIKSLRVAAQTLTHEVTHHRYNIGGCQKAEAICMAYEKMLIENRTFLYEDEWEYVKKLAIDNYYEPWEAGGIGKLEEYVRIIKRPKPSNEG